MPSLGQEEVVTVRHELDNVSLSPHISQREPRLPSPPFSQGDDLVALSFWDRLAMVRSKLKMCCYLAQVDYITKNEPPSPFASLHFE